MRTASIGTAAPADSWRSSESWHDLQTDPILERLAARLGERLLNRRLQKQVEFTADALSYRFPFFSRDNMYGLHWLLRWGLKLTGLEQRAIAATSDFEVTHTLVPISSLPEAFDGYRVLHMSDLHLDAKSPYQDALLRQLEELQGHYDLCCITGDFRMELWGPYHEAVDATAAVVEKITTPVYGILGNHDCVEMVDPLEELGIQMLLNESVEIERDGAQIQLIGVDDPHSYKTSDIARAVKGGEQVGTRLLLAHSAEIFREAAFHDVDLYLCGHTHGGQVCLPGGMALWLNARTPRQMCTGYWTYLGVQGYTSRGTGSSGLDVRMNCRPEIAIHTLRRRQ